MKWRESCHARHPRAPAGARGHTRAHAGCRQACSRSCLRRRTCLCGLSVRSRFFSSETISCARSGGPEGEGMVENTRWRPWGRSGGGRCELLVGSGEQAGTCTRAGPGLGFQGRCGVLGLLRARSPSHPVTHRPASLCCRGKPRDCSAHGGARRRGAHRATNRSAGFFLRFKVAQRPERTPKIYM